MTYSPLRVDVAHWITRQVIITDWYDGPREGVCALGTPLREFWFDLVAERRTLDHLDDRLFLLSDIPDGSVDRLVHRLSELGSPSSSVWVPMWSHQDPAVLRGLGNDIQEVRQEASRSGDVVMTSDMLTFLGLYEVRDAPLVEDWFEFLNL